MEAIDYLVAGYVTRDLTPTGYNVGGTAAYSGRLADMLGCRTAVITSTAPKEPGLDALPDTIQLYSTQSEKTSTYENIYTSQGGGKSFTQPLTRLWRLTIHPTGPNHLFCI